MRRFFIAQPVEPRVSINGSDARHIAKVLRLQPESEVDVVGNDGRAARMIITALTSQQIELDFKQWLVEEKEPPVRVILAQGLAKGDKMDYIVQKAVELGVSEIVPLALDRCVVRYEGKKQQDRVARWQNIAVEAAKQCRRSAIPEVRDIIALRELLTELPPDTAAIMLYEAENKQGLKDMLRSCAAKEYLLLIGPEGGFTPREADLCREYGVSSATMGPRILRTETAASAALAVLMYEHGDLGG
ncbi:16S rRNA (uracil(1498)-N(3))-methyltransferase [Azotosporobacter soli]|uniref:16S rRNA (uracil(1498)-N(3))-methyltransferase n=1 Tax=Azotosporobacter soli TaxID=3055040 RepID=UPI0031FE7AC8